MNNFSWSKALGFGVIIWVIMALATWILGSISSLSPLWAHGLAAVIGGVSAFFLGQNVKSESGIQAAGYGIVWVAILLLFDLVLTQWFDAHIFSIWQYWLGAVLVFLSPWVEVEARQTFSQSQHV